MALLPQAPEPNPPQITPSTGIIGNTLPTPSTGYQAKQVKLGSGDTVQGRISGIINKNSALMKSAQTRALQSQNARGTLNSTMAIGSGQQALYDTALPIAQQDATNSLQTKLTNAGNVNQAREFTAGASNTATNLDAQGAQDIRSRQVQGAIDTRRDVKLAGIQTERDAVLQEYALAQQQAAHLQGLAKDKALATAQKWRDQRLERIDLRKMDSAAEIQADRDAALQEYTLAQQQAAHLQGMEKEKYLNKAQTLRDNRLASIDKRKAEFDAGIQARRDLLLQRQTVAIKNLETKSEKELLALKQEFDKDVSVGGQATTLFAYSQDAISGILSNPDIPISNKQKLVEDQVTVLKAGLSMIGQISDIDLESMVKFGRLEPGKANDTA